MNTEIIINNNIPQEVVQLYDNNDNFIGNIENELAFNDVRIQIKNKKLSGYYIVFENEKYEIDRYGRLRVWPPIYETYENQLSELL